MGRFFNTLVMSTNRLPTEAMRKKFREEQENARVSDNTDKPQEGLADKSPTDIGSQPDIPVIRDGEGGVRPTRKGNTRKRRNNKRKRSPVNNRGNGTGLRGKDKGSGSESGTTPTDGIKSEGG